jgi:hypothetical protein
MQNHEEINEGFFNKLRSLYARVYDKTYQAAKVEVQRKYSRFMIDVPYLEQLPSYGDSRQDTVLESSASPAHRSRPNTPTHSSPSYQLRSSAPASQ